jgi:hypothetical protein
MYLLKLQKDPLPKKQCVSAVNTATVQIVTGVET